MKLREIQVRLLIFAFAFGLFAFGARAQDEPQQPQQTPPTQEPEQPPQETPPDNSIYGPPKPAGQSFPTLDLGFGTDVEMGPDYSPLTGMQSPTLGFPEFRHSFWVPGVQFSSNITSYPTGAAGNNTWSAQNFFIGNLTLLEAWSHSIMVVNYSGGGSVSTDSSVGSGLYQQFAFAQAYRTERWLFQLADLFSYLPQSSFGFGGGTNLGVPGVGGNFGTTIPGLGGNYVPNQSFYGTGASYSNVGAIQGTYALTRRASVTAAVSYGILEFIESGNFNSHTLVASLGYNYALSRNDTIGLVYRFSSYQFPGNPQAYGDHVVSIAYGRKLTGHIALRLFVGPEFTFYRVPVNGSTRGTGVSTTANLSYALQRTGFSFNYTHGLSAGSGVYLGSTLDQATASAYRRLTRAWTGNVNFGFARNADLGTLGAGAKLSYDNWFVGGGLNRPIGRNFNFGVAFTANIGTSACGAGGCAYTGTYPTVTVNLQWHPRPFILR